MSSTQITLLMLVWTAIAFTAAFIWRMVVVRRRTQNRLTDHGLDDALLTEHSVDQRSRVSWWLYRAGFRGSSATVVFTALSLLGLVCGAGVIWACYWFGPIDLAEDLLRTIPGGVGEVFVPFVWLSPWLAGGLLAFLPAVFVHLRRKRRVRQVEQDLPITLDLLATLAEAGFGFDSALDRFLETQPLGRALSEDLQLFQIDLLAGRPRVDALRRLMQRVDVAWFSIFVSAVIHAEQVGASLAQTLRVQADDLRMRRRERALALAMGVTVKLLFPLIVCFLPGVMVASLGPVVFQIVQVLDSFLQGTIGG